MREEGLEQVWGRHARAGSMIRAAVEALDLELLAAPGHRSDTVTAVRSPADSPESLKQFLVHLRARYGLVLAGGQDTLAGKIFRIGHLGMIDDPDVYSIVCVIEQGLVDLGLRSTVGLAAAAAQSQARTTKPAAEPAAVG